MAAGRVGSAMLLTILLVQWTSACAVTSTATTQLETKAEPWEPRRNSSPHARRHHRTAAQDTKGSTTAPGEGSGFSQIQHHSSDTRLHSGSRRNDDDGNHRQQLPVPLTSHHTNTNSANSDSTIQSSSASSGSAWWVRAADQQQQKQGSNTFSNKAAQRGRNSSWVSALTPGGAKPLTGRTLSHSVGPHQQGGSVVSVGSPIPATTKAGVVGPLELLPPSHASSSSSNTQHPNTGGTEVINGSLPPPPVGVVEQPRRRRHSGRLRQHRPTSSASQVADLGHPSGGDTHQQLPFTYSPTEPLQQEELLTLLQQKETHSVSYTSENGRSVKDRDYSNQNIRNRQSSPVKTLDSQHLERQRHQLHHNRSRSAKEHRRRYAGGRALIHTFPNAPSFPPYSSRRPAEVTTHSSGARGAIPYNQASPLSTAVDPEAPHEVPTLPPPLSRNHRYSTTANHVAYWSQQHWRNTSLFHPVANPDSHYHHSERQPSQQQARAFLALRTGDTAALPIQQLPASTFSSRAGRGVGEPQAQRREQLAEAASDPGVLRAGVGGSDSINTGGVDSAGTREGGGVSAITEAPGLAVSYSEQFTEYYTNANHSDDEMSATDEQLRGERQAKLECEERMRNTPYPTDGGIYCNRTFDGWGCFNDTPAGTRAYTSCPAFKKGFDPRLYGYKDCNPDGTWWRHPITNKTWTNYTTCVNADDLESDTRTLYIFFAGYSISMVALVASLFIFFYFRQLQCDRVTIHRNLFISYILNGISWILYYSLAAMNGDTMMTNPIWCQGLHVFTQYLVACNFFWMFCEGLYLHTIIVSAFTTGKKLIIACYIIGWCSPIITTIIYTALRASNHNTNKRCWLDETPLQYVVVGPIVLTIALNLAFLCNIVRVLITKLRAVNSPDTNQTRKAVRATLILIPLLGLQYILFPLRPDKGTPLHEVYSYISAFVTSFQGLFVALIFCFCNGEVMSVMKRKWGQHRLMHGNANGRTGIYTQTTVTMAENTTVPKSPRLYDNRPQNAGGKTGKNNTFMLTSNFGRGGRQANSNYEDEKSDINMEEVKCTTSAL